jgi:hypothetical protein
MSFLDKLKQKAPELKDKASGLASTHSDKIDQGITKAAGMASRASKGKYDAKIDDAASKAKQAASRRTAATVRATDSSSYPMCQSATK